MSQFQKPEMADPLSELLNRALTPRDVKNEGTSGDVYENKGGDDKMSCEIHLFFTKLHYYRHDRQPSTGLLGRKCKNGAMAGGTVTAVLRVCPKLGEWIGTF